MAILLRAHVPLIVQLNGSTIYSHEAPADKPASGRWIVVRERIDLGGVGETMSGLMSPVIQVMSESRDSLHTAEVARSWHAGVQDLCAKVLIGATLTITTGEAKLSRRIDRPSPVAYDADDASYYSTSTFACTMGPEDPE